ncbi:MAG TPA: methyltransferase domain-containing protein [Lacipirellulaceae bacterium]|nr:methyltransferase domain-containing protein [Lacipirellulaceae bacterium]
MRQRWADYRVFWRQFRDAYNSTGAVLPSGRALARALSRYVRERGEAHVAESLPSQIRPGDDSDSAVSEKRPYVTRRILEVGPGTGAVTAQIIHDMRTGDRLELVERNDQFVAHLRDRIATAEPFRSAADHITLLHAPVEELPDDQQYDLIISGLPLNNFSVESVRGIMNKFRRLLATGGTLSFFEYVAVRGAKSLLSGRAERERLTGISRLFREVLTTNEVRRDLVMANVTPAWVHHVRFAARSHPQGTRQGAGSTTSGSQLRAPSSPLL